MRIKSWLGIAGRRVWNVPTLTFDSQRCGQEVYFDICEKGCLQECSFCGAVACNSVSLLFSFYIRWCCLSRQACNSAFRADSLSCQCLRTALHSIQSAKASSLLDVLSATSSNETVLSWSYASFVPCVSSLISSFWMFFPSESSLFYSFFCIFLLSE